MGDVCSAQWWIYGFGPTDSHFDCAPFARDISVLHNGYADAGPPGADDPVGATRVTGIPNPNGRKATIRTNADFTRLSRISHCHMPGASVFRGTNAHWPVVSHELRAQYIFQKLAVLGVNPGLGGGGGIDHEVADLVTNAYYPRTIARLALVAVAPDYKDGAYAADCFPDVGRAGSSRSAHRSG